MKKVLKNNKGITLVALIITIIVLLILAMVSISLVMNSGIIDKSKTAVDKYSQEEVQEQIKLAYSEWQMGQYSGETRTAAEFMQAKLNSIYGTGAVTNVTETNGTFEVTFANGKGYLYNVSTGTTEKVAKWNDNGDGTFTYSETGTKVKIGDIVNYNELSNGAKSYTTDTTKGIGDMSSYSYNSTTKRYDFTTKTYITEDLTWRVLGINESGQIELISENPMSHANKVCLANEEGYIYGPEELDKMSNELYGKGNGALKARCLKVEDIDKLAGITTDADKKTLSSSYGKKWQYRYPTTTEVNGTRYMQYKENSDRENSTWQNSINEDYQKFKIPGERAFGKINDNEIIEGISPMLTNTEYNYTISSKINKITIDGKKMSDILTKGTSDNYIEQCLASRGVYCCWNGQYVMFFLYSLHEGYFNDSTRYNGVQLIDSAGNSLHAIYVRLRPVVILQSNIQLSGSSSEGWTIQ